MAYPGLWEQKPEGQYLVSMRTARNAEFRHESLSKPPGIVRVGGASKTQSEVRQERVLHLKPCGLSWFHP